MEDNRFHIIHCNPWNCRWSRGLISRLRHRIENLSARLSCDLGADWFRMDLFVLNQNDILVNEMTYPGHMDPDRRDMDRWYNVKHRLTGNCAIHSDFTSYFAHNFMKNLVDRGLYDHD